MRFAPGLVVLLGVAGCAPATPYVRPVATAGIPVPSGPVVTTFYALGDWGTGDAVQRKVAGMLRDDVGKLGPRACSPFVLEAGDNVYRYGLPEGWGNPGADSLLDRTFGSVYDGVRYQGEHVVFHIVPGNHDYAWVLWPHAKKGWGDAVQEETRAEALYPGWWRYYPMSLSGHVDPDDRATYEALRARPIETVTLPELVYVPEEAPVVVVAIDTQVLLDLYAKHDHAAINRHLDRLDSLLGRSRQPWKIVLGHHPVISYGEHGGYQNFHPGHPTDLNNQDYRAFRADLKAILREHQAIYIAGHDHTLQLLELGDGSYQVVSGSAGHGSPVTAKRETLYASGDPGYARFDVTPDALWITFRHLGETSASAPPVFRIPGP